MLKVLHATHSSRLLAPVILLVCGVLVHLGFQTLLFHPLENQIAHHSAAPVSQPAVETKSGYQEKIQEYLGILARQPNESDRVLVMHQIAEKHAVKIKSAQYARDLMDPEIRRLQINAELVGSYPNIRQFLRELAVHDLSLSWDAMSFTKNTSTQEVRLQIRFVLFSKA
jgi:hypothetical protein